MESKAIRLLTVASSSQIAAASISQIIPVKNNSAQIKVTNSSANLAARLVKIRMSVAWLFTGRIQCKAAATKPNRASKAPSATKIS